jgi:hypothetical protein
VTRWSVAPEPAPRANTNRRCTWKLTRYSTTSVATLATSSGTPSPVSAASSA